MLSIKNVTKVYTTKGGVEVRALDGVSVDFPDKGMVFLLGKSGSGKSTLLNVAGGLDAPDAGEIVVKGKSSRDFSQADFDSYRNTYVGFIFQEYNILNEFNVEQNIALALQLQGKKNDREAVEAILSKVDMAGLGKRKPLTLSGGQKQRVAIARALVKEPEIIMADEPTGALDSVTGKDVFDTLKKLSAEKLVVIVSHDREFAEIYGDRIIELKDGKIISDTVKGLAAPLPLSENVHAIDERTFSIQNAADLSESEFFKIWEKVKGAGKNAEIIVSADAPRVAGFKKANKIAADGSREYFKQTTESDIKAKPHDGSQTKFIKSRLPLKKAAKIGASSLKVKPVRLILTTVVALIAFAMFGIVSTMMMYDANFTAAKALEGTTYNFAYLSKSYQTTETGTITYKNYNDDKPKSEKSVGEYHTAVRISSSELSRVSNAGLGIKFAGVFSLDGAYDYLQDTSIQNTAPNQGAGLYYSFNWFRGFTDAGEAYLKGVFGADACLAGSYPVTADEIAVSEYLYGAFKQNGLKVYDAEKKEYGDNVELNSPIDIVGKYIRVQHQSNVAGGIAYDLKITGVYRTGIIDPKFDGLKEQGVVNNRIAEEFNETVYGGYHNLAYVSDTFYDTHVKKYAEERQTEQNSNILNLNYGYCPIGNIMLPDWLDALKDEAKIYAFSDASEVSVSEAVALKEDEVYLSLRDLFNRGQALMNMLPPYTGGAAEAGDGEDPQPEPSVYPYVDFIRAYRTLEYYLYGNWRGNAEDKPAERVFLQSDLAVVLDAIRAHWDTLVKTGPEGYYRGDADKLYYNGAPGAGAPYLKIKGVYVLNSAEFGSLIHKNTLNSMDYYNYFEVDEARTRYVGTTDGKYAGMITPLVTTRARLDHVLALNHLAADDSQFELKYNMVYENAASAAWMFEDMSVIFIWVGVGLAVVSALFLFNYISVSIIDKKREIGILRAVGARGTDVFKIFFSESFILAAVCAVLAIIASVVACVIINSAMVSSVFALQLLNFTPLNGLIILGVALVVAVAGTIIPVALAAKKPPVESIRSL